MSILYNMCENCEYYEEFNGKMICSFAVHNDNDCPEELPESRTCKDFKLKEELNF